ncbi:DUF1206 domain-containing protein [Cellulomonas soli]|uniref:Membrane protein n=1 Tax=Cellulomonas soli TaxID=931535 RepID=A0A512PGV2_9CELL|nr:DUF1206 domain-containing protein [Cellulomonas soli]NYI59636.1 hypothetical protein [Cellulomonas soli]GEP70430.1 membrane protein [Cellulomonas soli]
MNSADMTRVARRVNDHPTTGALARLGYVASGVLHLMLALVVVQVAWFGSVTSADQSGALGALASSPGGRAALWVVAVGFAGLAVWQVSEAVGTGGGAGARVKAASKAVLYAALAWTSVQFAQGAPRSSGEQSRDFTAELMSHQGGRFAVAGVGAVVLGVAAYHVHKGWTRGFLRDLREHPGRFVVAPGRLGYVAKGVALGVVGALFVAAAWHARPDEAGGLDAALRTLGDQPFGTALLTVVAAGFVAYAVYSFGRARYART